MNTSSYIRDVRDDFLYKVLYKNKKERKRKKEEKKIIPNSTPNAPPIHIQTKFPHSPIDTPTIPNI